MENDSVYQNLLHLNQEGLPLHMSEILKTIFAHPSSLSCSIKIHLAMILSGWLIRGVQRNPQPQDCILWLQLGSHEARCRDHIYENDLHNFGTRTVAALIHIKPPPILHRENCDNDLLFVLLIILTASNTEWQLSKLTFGLLLIGSCKVLHSVISISISWRV